MVLKNVVFLLDVHSHSYAQLQTGKSEMFLVFKDLLNNEKIERERTHDMFSILIPYCDQ